MDVRTWVHGSDPSAGSRPRGTRGTPSAIRSTWWVTWWVAVGCAVLAGATIGGVDAAAVERRPVHDVRVIVRTEQGATGDVVARARELGAREVEVLPFVDSFSSTMPATTADRLRVDADVVTVVPDGAVTVQGGGGSGARHSKYLKAIGADHVHRRGVTGRGVTVALVDTGVTAVDDLRGRLVQVTDDLTGEVAPCANFSGEPTCDDGYGHGTFLAGIIAGDGSASRGAHVGVAPAANVLSVKVAGRNGATDVSTVLSAIQWVVSFKDRYDISVLNLSLGTDSTASTTSDPLNYAVERACSGRRHRR